jgi:hypothetical protein
MRTVAEIASDIAQREQAKAELDAGLKALNVELRDAVGNEFKAAFEVANKMAGDITLAVDGIKLKGKIPKKVTWDNVKLQVLASSMPWERASKIFDIKFSVPEKNYSAVSIGDDAELLAALDAARTVEFGDLKIEVAGV